MGMTDTSVEGAEIMDGAVEFLKEGDVVAQDETERELSFTETTGGREEEKGTKESLRIKGGDRKRSRGMRAGGKRGGGSGGQREIEGIAISDSAEVRGTKDTSGGALPYGE